MHLIENHHGIQTQRQYIENKLTQGLILKPFRKREYRYCEIIRMRINESTPDGNLTPENFETSFSRSNPCFFGLEGAFKKKN